MKVIRHPDPPTPKGRPIMRFDQPPPAPAPVAHEPPRGATATAREALRKAQYPGEIDPRQMVS